MLSFLVANSKVTPVPARLTEVPIKVPAHNVPGKLDTWKANREAESLWAGDIDGNFALCLLICLHQAFHQVPITFVVRSGDICRLKVHFNIATAARQQLNLSMEKTVVFPLKIAHVVWLQMKSYVVIAKNKRAGCLFQQMKI